MISLGEALARQLEAEIHDLEELQRELYNLAGLLAERDGQDEKK